MEQLRHPRSAPGDFYVVNNECLSCGVPHAVAPDLVGWADDQSDHCYWMKQPENENELNQAFAIFDGQEAGCHRYAGRDPLIQQRIGFDSCDYPLSPVNQVVVATKQLFAESFPAEEESSFRKLWRRIVKLWRKNM